MKKQMVTRGWKGLICFMAATILLLALSGAGAADDRITRNLPKFTDVPEGHWAVLNITRLTFEGAITGYPDGTFGPERSITRAEFLAVVIGALLERPQAPAAGQHWATNIVSEAEKNNLLEAGEFAQNTWDTPINRQEMAKIMARGAQYVRKEALTGKTSVYTSKVTDFDATPEAYRPYVAQVYAKGIVGGYTDGSFGGGRQATRAEAVTMVVRLIDPVARLTVAIDTDEPIAFNPAMDVATDGRMKLEKAEEYMMRTLQSLRFYEEDGKFCFEGDVAGAPEGYRHILSIEVGFTGSANLPVAGYGSYPTRAQKALPKSGPFTVELENVTSRSQIAGVTVILYISAVNHTNTSYDQTAYEILWTVDTTNDNRIEVDDYITYEKSGSKFYDFSQIFQW